MPPAAEAPDFDAVLKLLAESHAQEVKRLQGRINDLNKTLRQSTVGRKTVNRAGSTEVDGKSLRQTYVTQGSALKSSALTLTQSPCEGGVSGDALPSERHNIPVFRPKLAGASLSASRGASNVSDHVAVANDLSPRTLAVKMQLPPAPASAMTASRVMLKPCLSHEPPASPDSAFLHEYAFSADKQEREGTKKASFTFQDSGDEATNEANLVIRPSRQDSPKFELMGSGELLELEMCSATLTVASDQEITFLEQRWHDMAEGLIAHRNTDFQLLAGWAESRDRVQRSTNKSQRSTQESGALSGSEPPSSTTKMMLGFHEAQKFLNESQKTAISKLEAKARKGADAPVKSRRTSQSNRALRGGLSLWRKVGFGRSNNQHSQTTQPGSCLVSHPASPRRRMWIILCLLVILYEIFAITMEPFEVLSSSTAKQIDWVLAFFWTTDIVVNFFSGIYREGKVEMRFKIVARSYIRSWFFFDLIVASSQFFSLLVEAEGSGATALLRIVRCVRSVRLGRVFYWLKDEFNLSNTAITGTKIVQFLIFLYFFCHCSACIWYEVGKAKDGWTTGYAIGDSAGSRYLISLHWSLSQLQGQTDIHPGESIWDRLIIVLSSYSSIVVLTFFVSSMTDTLFQARQQMKRKLDESYTLQNFFDRHDVDPELRARAKNFIKQKEKQQSAMEDYEQDQRALNMFPAAMRSALRSEIWASCLIWHPTFAYLFKYSRNVFCKVCSHVLEFHTYDPNDDVFTIGELSNHAFFVYEGDFVLNTNFDLMTTVAPWLLQDKKKSRGSQPSKGSQSPAEFANFKSVPDVDALSRPSRMSKPSRLSESLSRGSGSSVGSQKFTRPCRPVMRVGKGQTVSEASLWISWVHSGDLCAVDHGQCFSIGTAELLHVVEKHPSSHTVFQSYAMRFLSTAKIIRQEQTGKLTTMEMMTFQNVLEVEELLMQQRKRHGSAVHFYRGSSTLSRLSRNASQRMSGLP